MERLPYGIVLTCNHTATAFDFLPINAMSFLDNPIKNSYIEISTKECKNNQIELRVKKTTPYAVLMLSEIEIFESN